MGRRLLALFEVLLYNPGVGGEIGVLLGKVAEVSMVGPPGFRGKPPLLSLFYKPGKGFFSFHVTTSLPPLSQN